jgi:hypothetical protein
MIFRGLVTAATLYIYFFLFQTFIQHIHIPSPRHISIFFISYFAQKEKPSWDADEPGFELGPAMQQASAAHSKMSHAAP